jgi:hypothetical protein
MITTTIEFNKYELGTVTTACYEEWHRTGNVCSLEMAVKLCRIYLSMLGGYDPYKLKEHYTEYLELWERELDIANEGIKDFLGY